MMVCLIFDMAAFWPPRDVAPAAEHVYTWYKRNKLLPENPAGFSDRVTSPHAVKHSTGPIRVLLIAREHTRAILNHAQLLESCNSDSGPWECRDYLLGSSLAK
jgi:hypothetical protein